VNDARDHDKRYGVRRECPSCGMTRTVFVEREEGLADAYEALLEWPESHICNGRVRGD
jgi:hypothetical protein